MTTQKKPEPIFFDTPNKWRKWLEKNHQKASEVQVGYYKTSTGKKSITWPESVDQALCFGWIDGVRHSLGEESYTIRFTPRKPGSIWSAINIKKVAELTEQGLMQPAGLAAFEKLKENKSRIYSFEQDEIKIDKAYEKKLNANKKAASYFKSKGASYQKAAKWWVISAKQETTRIKRLEQLIACSEAGAPLPHLAYTKKNK